MTGRRPQGFASMDQARRREVARRGGFAVQQSGRAHKWTPETAQVAGRKGAAVRIAKAKGVAVP
jgi:general stress protein YciG